MSQDDGAIGFMFYMFIVYPVTSYLLKSFKGNRGLFLAIGFLGFIAIGKTAMEIDERPPNYYSVLYVSPSSGVDEIVVTRASNSSEIRRAWKRKSLELHPDKNPSPEARLQFERVKEAYEVLNNHESRMLYNKFGEAGLQKAMDGNEVLLEMAVTYVTWAMLVFVLTLGKSSSSARNWIYSGQIGMLILEVSLTLQEMSLPDWLLPTTTEFEIIWLMHTMFPAFMNGCRVIGSFYYVDIDELTKNTLLSLRDSHNEILEKLTALQHQLDTGVKGKASLAKPSIADKVLSASPEEGKENIMSPSQKEEGSNHFAIIALCAYIVYYTWSQ